MRVGVNDLIVFCTKLLSAVGLNQEDSRITVEALVLTDTWGVHTHGTKNLGGYIRRLRAGGIRPDGRPRVDREGPAWAIVDGDGAVGMVASSWAMKVTISKARETGFAFVGLRNSCHFGAAGVYSNIAAAEGMIGIAMSNDTPTVAAPGSRSAVLGSNPISFAIPREGAEPILLDIATSTVAGGKVFKAAAHGETIPEGWLIDSCGEPTTDPNLFPEQGALTPMSGHKGYGIALLIETLSAVITGAAIGNEVLSWSFADPKLKTNHGACFIAINLHAITAEFQKRLLSLIQQISKAPRRDGADRIYLPGEKEWEKRRKALVEGLELPEEIVAALKETAKELKVPTPF